MELKALNLQKIVEVPTRDRSIAEAFLDFHSKNPHVYRNLKLLSSQVRKAGRTHIGMKFLFERLRWEYMIGIENPQHIFKLNNNILSFKS